ncbi:acyl-CoA carboxylase subunit epsilon [Streptomyces sp. NBC_01381]|uniref:acyl-CoA carboxylase subunit epsilon n=1 Tax=Streptomyces sp. NBC_01381 TaxID=2903845 RepID=UPI00224D3485|nr:acyl-CoA carboxylase subunit epsilon [Streptomyces sp. NBC_01381]MCX4673480.1 acyl-CoA carboxylase subunit epsilon [Streptomyces sp. NBC_01381]
MTIVSAAHTLLRVEKGHAEPEELAAIALILMARAAAPGPTAAHRPRSRAGWRRLERERGFRAPHSWR